MAIVGEGYSVDRAGPGVPVLLAFDGRSASDGEFPHAGLLRRIARLGQHSFSSILLHDRARAGFYRGIPGLGGTIDEVAEALKSLVAGLEASEVLAFGEGLGGHAALVFGVLLGARRIVAIEPAAHLIPDELARYNDRRWNRELVALPDPETARRFDVPALISRTGFRGRASILFGTRHDNDREDVHLNAVHAFWIARSDRATLYPYPEVERGVLDWLARRGHAEDVLAQHLFEDVPAPAFPQELPPPDPAHLRVRRTIYYNPKVALISSGIDRAADPAEGSPIYASIGAVDAGVIGKVDDEWRRWIAENLVLDAPPEGLVNTMVARGIPESEAAREVNRARFSPYLRGARLVQARTKKRDWLIAVYRKLDRCRRNAGEIGRRHRLSRDDFLADHFTTGRPLILTGMIGDWPAPRAWSLDDLARRFRDRATEIEAEVEAGGPGEGDRGPTTLTVPMTEFLTMLGHAGPLDRFSLSAGADFPNPEVLDVLRDDIGPIPDDLAGSGRPVVSFWIGSAGASPPAASRDGLPGTLLAQVMGRVRVRVVLSWDLTLLERVRERSSWPDRGTTPVSAPLPIDQPRILECVLSPGEVVFLPVGCGAFVESLDLAANVTFNGLDLDSTAAQ